MLNPNPLARDESFKINFKVAIRKHEPLISTNKHPLFRVLPHLFSNLSLMEILLEKKSHVLGQLDMTSEDSQAFIQKTEQELVERISLCDKSIQNMLKTALPTSNISYFLFQYDLSMLFPKAGKYFGAPIDPYTTKTDFQGHLKNMALLQSLSSFIKRLQSELQFTKQGQDRSLIPDLVFLTCQTLTNIGRHYDSYRVQLAAKFDVYLDESRPLTSHDKKWLRDYLMELKVFLLKDDYIKPEGIDLMYKKLEI